MPPLQATRRVIVAQTTTDVTRILAEQGLSTPDKVELLCSNVLLQLDVG